MTISIPQRGYIPTKDEVSETSLEKIQEEVKAKRAETLKKIQEEALKKAEIPQPKRVVKESISDSEKIPELYGTDENDPDNAEFFAELRRLKKTNPGLYGRIISMH